MKHIKLPAYGIEIDADVKDRSGSLVSNLHDYGEGSSEYNAAVDGLEGLILAMACAGLDVESPAFLEALETAYEGIENHHG